MSLSLFTLLTFMVAFPNDFAVNYNYVSGTISPPFRFEYAACIDSKGNGIITYKPDFVFDTTWVEKFKLPKKRMRVFWSYLKKTGFFSKDWTESPKNPVGGSIQYLEINANNKSYKIPTFPLDKENSEKIFEEVKKLIPLASLDTLSAKKEKCIEEFNKQKK